MKNIYFIICYILIFGTISRKLLRSRNGHLHGFVLGKRSPIDFERNALHRETRRSFGVIHSQRSYELLSRLSAMRVQPSELNASGPSTDSYRLSQLP